MQTEKIECKADQVVLEGNKIDLTSETDTILEEKRIDLASIDDTFLEEKRIDLTSNNDTLLEEKRIDPASENDTILEEYSSATSVQLPREEGAEHTDIQIGGNIL